MKSLSALVALLVAVSAAVAQQFTINTPTGVTSCQPTRFTWVGGSGPFILTLTQGTTTGGATLKEFDGISGTGFTWNVDVPGGTSFICNLKDTTGNIVQSAAVNVGDGGSSCVNTSVTETATGVTSGAQSTGAATTSAPAGTNTSGGSTPTTSGGASSPSGGSTSAGASSTGSATTGGSASQSSGASQQLTAAGVGMAGIMGAIGAMLF